MLTTPLCQYLRCGYTPLTVDMEDVQFFVVSLVPEALLRCRRVVFVAKLKHCHVPSSAKAVSYLKLCDGYLTLHLLTG